MTGKDMEREDRDRLIQIEAKLDRLTSDVTELRNDQKGVQQLEIEIALVKREVERMQDEVSEVKKELVEKYVTQDEFEPIRRVFWLVAGSVATMIVAAVLSLIFVL